MYGEMYAFMGGRYDVADVDDFRKGVGYWGWLIKRQLN